MKNEKDPTILYMTLFILIIIVIIVINYHETNVKEGFTPCDVDITKAFALPYMINAVSGLGNVGIKGSIPGTGLGLNLSCTIC